VRAVDFGFEFVPWGAGEATQLTDDKRDVGRAQVGAEEAVPLTAALERAGEVEVVAAFAGDALSAAAAARGEKSSGALVLKRVVKVAP
jgi:hypothetical protein